jgi:hypothetical protein
MTRSQSGCFLLALLKANSAKRALSPCARISAPGWVWCDA